MSAHLSEDGRYRYSLTRDVAPLTGQGTCTFVMLNPSTADATEDDPTIRRCLGFARKWGYARLNVVNLFAYRATDPRELLTVADPVGPENDRVLSAAFGGSDLTVDLVVAAWGAWPGAAERIATVMAWPLRPRFCLGLTKSGSPKHPLYVVRTTWPKPYTPRSR